MASARTQCPGCSAGIRLKTVPQAGRKIRCPRCKSAFLPVLGDPETSPDDERRRNQRASVDSAQAPTAEPGTDLPLGQVPDIVTAQPSISGGRRTRRKRGVPRLWIFAATVVGIAGAASGLWLYQQQPSERSTQNQHGAGTADGNSSLPVESDIVEPQPLDVVKQNVQPLTLQCIPVVPQFLLHLRPAELWGGTAIHQEFAASLGELDHWLQAAIEAVTTLKVRQIEELTIAVNFGSRGSTPDYCMVVRPVSSDAGSPEWLMRLVGEPLEGLADAARLHDSRAWMKIDANSYAVANGDLVDDLTDSRHYPALPSSAMASLLQQTDRSHQLTLLGDIAALDAHRDFMLPPQVHGLSEVLLSPLRDEVTTLSWSLHLEEHLELRTQIVGSASTSASQLQRHLSEVLASSPADTLTFVQSLKPQTAGQQKLAGRLPAMMQALHWGTTVSITDRVVLLSTLLPPKAAANLTAAVLVSSDVGMTGAALSAAMRPVAADKPISIAEQLQRSLLVDFRREPLREAIAYLNFVLDTKIQIDASALEAAGFTQNMPQTLSLGDATVSAAIKAMLEQYEGKLIVATNGEQTTLTLTTPTAAARSGLVDVATE